MVIQSTGVLTNLANAVEDRFEYGVGLCRWERSGPSPPAVTAS